MGTRTVREIQRCLSLPTTVPLDEGETVEGPDFVESLLERLVYERKMELIMASLSSCTPPERSVIEGLMAGYPAEEIAKQRQVHPSRVSHHKRNALAKIRAAILDQYPELMASSN